MDLYLNELSIHDQLTTADQVYEALERLMLLRGIARAAQTEVRCPRHMGSRPCVGGQELGKVVQSWSSQQKRTALLAWVSKAGPFLDREPGFDPDEWVEEPERPGEPITESGLGQAALRTARGHDAATISLTPSRYTRSPLAVVWRPDEATRRDVEVNNVWDAATMQRALSAAVTVSSWDDLGRWAHVTCPRLTFTESAFDGLQGQPFSEAICKRFQELLRMLDTMKSCFHKDGTYNDEWHANFRAWFFRGEHFSDASENELNTMEERMKFPDPEQPGQKRLFSWHGKVTTRQFRVHFSWPIVHDKPLYIAYLGPKLTKT